MAEADLAIIVRARDEADQVLRQARQQIRDLRREIAAIKAPAEVQRLQRELAELRTQAERTEGSFARLRASVGQGFRGAFAGGFGGAALGAAAATAAIEGLRASVGGSIAAAREQAQVQLQVNRVFGESAEVVRRWADSQADALGRSRVEMAEAVAILGQLQRNYGLTTEQVRRLALVTADLAAVKGMDLVDAATRVNAAIRGEAESIEALGINVQVNALKQFAQMTAAQREHFEALDQVTQARIRYREILRQAAFAEGAAAERAETAAGSFDRLSAALQRVAVVAGGPLLEALASVAGRLADGIEAGERFVGVVDELRRRSGVQLPSLSNVRLPSLGELAAGAAGGPGAQFVVREVEAVERLRGEVVDHERQIAVLVRQRAQAEEQLAASLRQEAEALEAATAEAERHRQAMAAQRVSQLAREEERLAQALREQAAADELATAETERHRGAMAAARQTAEALAREHREVAEAVRGALAAVAPGEREALAERLAAAGLEGAREELARLAADPVQRARDAIRAVQEAEREVAEAAREAERRTQEARLAALDAVMEAEQRRHEAALEHLERERDVALAALDAELGRLEAAREATRQGEEERRLREQLERAEFQLAVARGETRRFRTPGEQAAAIREAEDAVEAARRAIREAEAERAFEAQREALQAQREGVARRFEAERLRELGVHERATEVVREQRALVAGDLVVRVESLSFAGTESEGEIEARLAALFRRAAALAEQQAGV